MDDLLTSGAAAISSGILLRLEEYLDIYDAGIAVQQVNIEQRQRLLKLLIHLEMLWQHEKIKRD